MTLDIAAATASESIYYELTYASAYHFLSLLIIFHSICNTAIRVLNNQSVRTGGWDRFECVHFWIQHQSLIWLENYILVRFQIRTKTGFGTILALEFLIGFTTIKEFALFLFCILFLDLILLLPILCGWNGYIQTIHCLLLQNFTHPIFSPFPLYFPSISTNHSMASTKCAVLLSKNVLTETMKTGDQILLECGRGPSSHLTLCIAAYTTARSVNHTKIFRLSQHVDRLCNHCHFSLP